MYPVQLLIKNLISLYLFFLFLILLSVEVTYSPEVIFAQAKSIYAQSNSDDMHPIIDDFLVNDDTVSISVQQLPSIAQDPSGDFVVAWEDYRNGESDIYAQRYNLTGSPIGLNFKVNDDFRTGQNYPAIAMDFTGNFIITWEDTRNGESDIYAQRYNSSGTPLGSNFMVNDDAGDAVQRQPAIAMDSSGDFVITWEDNRNDGTWNIYAQRYNSSGAPTGSNFKVNDDTGTARQHSPAITIDSSGNFVITWEDYRNDLGDIYAQRYNSSGIPSGSNFKVNDDVGTGLQWYPAISMDGSGNFIITWQDARSNWNIYAQRYNSSGSPLGSNFKINDRIGTALGGFPAITMNRSGNFVITWHDERNGNCDIYAQRYNSSGSPLDSNFKVNDDVGTACPYYPVIAMNNSGNFVITWHDHRNGNGDIYAQKYNSLGSPLGSNFKVNDDVSTADQFLSAIAMDNRGNFVITWEDYRKDVYGGDIYAQRYDFSGSPSGSNFKVNSDTGTAYQWYPAIAMDGSGKFVVAWQDERISKFDIYAQRFNSSGAPLGSNFKVNDDVGATPQAYAAVAIDGSGDFVITWEDDRNSISDVYAQRYNSTGAPLGSNFKVNEVSWAASRPFIAMDDSGNFIITWQDYRNGNYDIYAQRYSSSGTSLGSNLKVNDEVGTANQWSPAIAMDDSGNFVITWYDYRNGLTNPDIYVQRYNSFGDPIGGNCLVPNAQYSSFAQTNPAVVANNSNIYLVWQDNRRSKGWDIYAKVVDWNWTKVGEEEIAGLPSSFELGQNYPNPFNPTTTIQFRVGSLEFGRPLHTTLKIYNVLGQLVKTLVDEEKLPENYNIIWDGKDDAGKDVASGIYFYQLKTKNYTATKKMVLLR
ncbi:MAG: T9SS type A sorting domain-containing protein [candidate division Zixibacteria bacterium]|nr:T9SS type A sorting domain-containing protein [candidate division Zixibacteria bacterium]